MELGKFAALALVAMVLIVLLRGARPEQGALLSILATALLTLWLLGQWEPILGQIQRLLGALSLGEGQGELLLKTLGICFLSQTAGDLCRDAGEKALGEKVELAGKSAVLLLCLPLLEELLELVLRLMD